MNPRWDLLVSECNSVFLINARRLDARHIRVGALLCANTTQAVARFNLDDQCLQLLIPQGCLDAGQITKTFNLDVPILQSDG